MNNFKKELYDLLNKYNASITFECDDCSDTYGIYHPKIVIDQQIEKGVYVTLIECYGYSLDKSDINLLEHENVNNITIF